MRRRLLIAFLAAIGVRPVAAEVWLATPGPMTADGKTESILQLVVPGAEPGDRVRVSSEAGRTGRARITAGGVITVPWTPDAVDGPTEVGRDVRVRGSVRVDEHLDVAVAPPPSGQVRITFEPAELPSSGGPVTVRFALLGTSPQATWARTRLTQMSAGTLTSPKRSEEGGFTATLTPPDDLETPGVVLFAAADAAAPTRILGGSALPVDGRRDVAFDAPAGSSNELQLNGRHYGPTLPGADGKVHFPVEVHPAARVGTLTTTARDEEPVDR